METWQPQPQPRREGRATAVRLLAAVVVLGGAYAGLCAWAADHVPASLTVGGIRVGGMTAERATAAVERGAQEVLQRPIHLTVPGRAQPVEVVPRDVGLDVDVEGSLGGLTGFTLDPRAVWSKLTGAEQRPLLTRVDPDRLGAAVRALAPTLEQPPTEGTVDFAGGRVSVSVPRTGRTIDVAGTALALRRAFPDTDTATAAVRDTQPAVSGTRVLEFADTIGAAVVSGPVTLVAGPTRVLVRPAEYLPFVRVEPDGGGGLRAAFDEPGLARLVAAKVRVPTRAAASARWVFAAGHGAPRLVPAVEGAVVDQDAVAKAMAAAVTGDGAARTVTVASATAQPPFSTLDAQRAGVTTVVAQFDAPFPKGDAALTRRLVAVTQRLDGRYVPPGGTFRLLPTVGEWAATSGQTYDPESSVLVDGRVVQGLGGGISPLPTLAYNLGHLAGARVTARTAHASWAARYPAGRDAAVSWPSVDLAWQNDSPYGLLVQAWVTDGVVHGRVWSTKAWDVSVRTGPRTNVVQPRTVTRGDLSCRPQAPVAGFEVTVTREWRRPGTAPVVRSEPVTTTYAPQDGVVCSNPNVLTP